MQPRRARRRIDGVLLLDKPAGMSSNGALQSARRLYEAEKAGHTGTLDPLATGVLPVCFGEATKFASFLLDARKGYVATLRFGVTTTTLDAEGEVLSRREPRFDEAALREVLARFEGDIEQLPPMHSALKLDGRPYYEYARRGVEIERRPRRVHVERIVLEAFEPPEARIAVDCSKGTYVRTLAADIGEALGCGAHLSALRRTRTGPFGIADAHGLDALAALDAPGRDALLLPMLDLVAGLPRVALGADEALRFGHGQALAQPAGCEGTVAVLAGGRLLGVAEAGAGALQPRRLVAPH